MRRKINNNFNDFFSSFFPSFSCKQTKAEITNLYIKGYITKEEFMRRMKETEKE